MMQTVTTRSRTAAAKVIKVWLVTNENNTVWLSDFF